MIENFDDLFDKLFDGQSKKPANKNRKKNRLLLELKPSSICSNPLKEIIANTEGKLIATNRLMKIILYLKETLHVLIKTNISTQTVGARSVHA